MRPSIISEGATISTPAWACTTAFFTRFWTDWWFRISPCSRVPQCPDGVWEHKQTSLISKIFSPNLSTFRSSNSSINYEINTYPYLSKFISYEREYFVSKLFGDDLRVTIDKNILSKEFINNNLKRTKRLDTSIVELKIKYKLYEDVSFQNMNFLTRVGFSKYSEA